MVRIYDILNSVNETLAKAAQKTYKGQKRSELKDSDFLFPETRSFPIVTPQDIPDAISNFGRMKGTMSYDSFLKKLYNMAKRKGPAFVAALPVATKEKLGIKQKSKAEDESPEMEMEEYKQDFYSMSVSSIKAIETHAKSILDNLENSQVKENLTESFLQGKIAITDDYMRMIHDYVMFSESDDDTSSVDAGEKKKKKMPPFAPSLTTPEPASPPSGPTAPAIPAAEEVDTHNKKKKKISIKNLYKSIFIKNDNDNEDDYDTLDDVGPKLDYSFTADSGDKPGLWDNIRKKKERMGKNYRPAKPGQKDRPDPEQWKKLTK